MYLYYEEKDKTGAPIYAVGCHELGAWVDESKHATREAAADRVHYLNGGAKAERPTVAELNMIAAAGDDIDRRREQQRLDMFTAAALTGILSRVDGNNAQGFYAYLAITYAKDVVQQLNSPLSSPPEPPAQLEDDLPY